MAGEREWVEAIQTVVQASLPDLIVKVGHRLPYVMHVVGYRHKSNEAILDEPSRYQTDLLIAEQRGNSTDWVPRVVIEFKLGTVTTHDALTYSTKAATHKNVHPYLRYGIVIGKYPNPVPKRLIRHGHQFDFTLTLPSEVLSDADRKRLGDLLRDEVQASQQIEKLVSEKSDVRLVHRKLVVSS